ncbi:hypothetical protein CANMA_004869 [Candida margitis]|uniref:uncharacterized protein n=1 Tax=Candida margitis TaxID=1775924 RepID=UPI0022262E55|nr:uncharacterized protein CANMA_004869 [Candida margitis]KAI5954030.1 hypothetical protein CANMA_004869 [Candida margitis]
MGNNSLIYLSQNNIPINCSVYSLTNGTIKLLDHYNQTWNNATNLHKLLPAYFITNCSIPRLIELVSQQENSTSSHYHQNGNSLGIDGSPYNERDNGDTFIALLFTLCGSCVSCWMLSLLLYLTPKHRRKPWLAQITTIFYAIVTSVLLDRLTKAAEVEYYHDNLDIIKLNCKLYDNNVYRVLMILTQAFTMSSWFQIIQRLVRSKYKSFTAIVNFILMGTYIAIYTYFQVTFTTRDYITHEMQDFTLYHRWDIAGVTSRLLVAFWFLGVLAYYTTVMKNPRKICYSKKLLPLAILVWSLFILDIVINILHVSLFRMKWLVRTWLVLIPYLIEIILLTVIWEWIYNIWILEKRYELMNVLGRRISYEDIVSFKNNDSAKKSSKLDTLLDWVISKITGQTTINHVEERSDDSLKEYFTSTNSEGSVARTNSIPLQDREENLSVGHTTQEGVEGVQSSHDSDRAGHDFHENEATRQTEGEGRSHVFDGGDMHDSQGVSGEIDEYDDQYVNDYDMWSDEGGEVESSVDDNFRQRSVDRRSNGGAGRG